MPSLVLLGIRTVVAGDELRCFSVLAMILRIIEIVLDVPLLVMLSNVWEQTKKEAVGGDDGGAAVVVCNRRARRYSENAVAIMYAFLLLTLVSATLQLVNDALIYKFSGVGVPVETHKRQSRLSWLCAIKFGPNAILRILALLLGIVSVDIVDDYCECPVEQGSDSSNGNNQQYRNVCPNYYVYSGFLHGLMVTLLIETCATLFVYLYLALNLLRPGQRIQTVLRRPHSVGDRGGSTFGWATFCRCCCTCTSILTCCLFGGIEAVVSDFVDISVAMEELFDDAGHLDVTFSDIITGLILLAREQSEKRSEMMLSIVRQQRRTLPSREIASSGDPPPLDRDDGGARFSLDAPAPEDASNSKEKREPKRKIFQHLLMLRDGEDHSSYFEHVEREILDSSLEEDRSALVEGAHFMRYAMAIYGHGMYLINHGVRGLCPLGCGMVLCRGCRLPEARGDNPCRCYSTAFLQESRIDPDNVAYANFAAGVEKRPYCVLVDRDFSAIVIVVRGTFALEDAVTDMTLSPVSLEEAGAQYGFDGKFEYAHTGMFASAEWLARDLKRTGVLESLRGSHPDYRLYITGHSLGAGVAAILALLLHSSFPTLKCLAFEPPGCVLSTGISLQDYIVSYVHGADLVPRLSVTALEGFRDDVLEMIARSQVPKFKVLHPNPLGRKKDVTVKLAHRRTSIPESTFHNQLKEFWAYQRDRKSERGERSVQLFIPGTRIVHLVKTNEGGCARAALPTTTPIWARREDFLEIQLASSLITDHDTATLTRELERLAGAATIQPSK